MKNIELERTFLAKFVPEQLSSVKPVHISDTYLPENAAVPAIRLRQKGERYFIIKKLPIDGDLSRHTEDDIELSQEEYDVMRSVSRRSVSKDRYFVTIDGYDAQIDIFDESFTGLVLIDFEFASDEAKDSFVMPEYCLAEVTDEWFIAGGQLAGKRYADIEADLKRYRYQALVR